MSEDSASTTTPGGVPTVDELVDYFAEGETPREEWKVGTEHEKIGLLTDTGARVPFEGDRGIRRVLERIAEADGWEPVLEGENLIALEKDGASITLEPGGQIELSGAPLRTIHETCREFTAHVELVKQVSEDLGIAWLGLGGDPLHRVDEIPVMPKARYAIMRRYLPTRGRLSQEMMHATATVQANFDFSDLEDMRHKMRMAMGVSPIVSAIYANSPLSEGKPNGFVSRRVEVWRHTDPDRCGVLPFVFDPEFCYRDYAEWALDVPMFFVVRDGTYLPAKGKSFRAFLRDGLEGHTATLGDWDVHLTTVFPEVRLKRYIEVRGADAVPAELICALPALWKGLLYDPETGAAAWELTRSWSLLQRDEALQEVGRYGLAARVGGRPVLELARELTSLSREGLRRIGDAGQRDADETPFLDPIEEILERGKSPGEQILELWNGEWQGRLARLIEYTRY